MVTPGLIDAHTVVGLAGYLNQPHDQEQVEASAPIQPELRAMDAYNPEERLVAWVRGYGITTLHTGHGPQALVSGQTMIVKTAGRDVDAATVRAHRHDRGHRGRSREGARKASPRGRGPR